MTSRRIVRLSVILCLSFICAGLLPGCGAAASAIPKTTTVELPDGTTQEVTLGAGVASLADTTWRFNQDLGDGSFIRFATITFGSEGNLTSFEDNTLAPEIFGDTLLFDGAVHATSQQGLSYTAGTFGAETADATGFAFEGKLAAFAAGFQVATGEANASGTFDADDPDRMTGTISIVTEVTFPGFEDANVDEKFDFFAVRVVTE
jgi:hypothetical protein